MEVLNTVMSVEDYKKNTISGVSKLFKEEETNTLTKDELESIVKFFSMYGIKLEPVECDVLSNLTPEEFKSLFSEKIQKQIDQAFRGYFGI